MGNITGRNCPWRCPEFLGSQISPRGFLIAGHPIFIVIVGARLFISGPELQAADPGAAEVIAVTGIGKIAVQRWTPTSIAATAFSLVSSSCSRSALII